MSEPGDPGASVVAALEASGVPYELLPCDPDLADTAAFCAHYGFSAAESANTIVVVGKGDPKRYVACVVTADRRLDVNGAIRRRLGVKKASFASADETLALTGMAIGGVTPFGLPAAVPLWIDSAVLEQPLVIIGGGSRSQKVRLAPSGLLAAPGAEVVEGLATPASPPTPMPD
jgi:prolyl-tRNA editing enzyme YbaK/EbsC (Cys-tRNA(Pro) deacylase)